MVFFNNLQIFPPSIETYIISDFIIIFEFNFIPHPTTQFFYFMEFELKSLKFKDPPSNFHPWV